MLTVFFFQQKIFLDKMGTLLTLLHSEKPKLRRVLAVLSAIGLRKALIPGEQKIFLDKMDTLLTLLHSEDPKLHSFGSSKCSRV